jgi:hypothetical protein
LLAPDLVGYHKRMALKDVPANGRHLHVDILTFFDLDRRHSDPDPYYTIKRRNIGSREAAGPGSISKNDAALLKNKQCSDYSCKNIYIEPLKFGYRKEVSDSRVCY